MERIEKRIGKAGFSSDASLRETKAKGLAFKMTICIKTAYNMIGRGDFLNFTKQIRIFL